MSRANAGTKLASLLWAALALSACGGADTGAEREPVAEEGSSEAAEAGEDPGAPDEGPPPEEGPPPGEGEANLVVGEDPCETDADCVAAACCHAAACVAQTNAPSCADVMCTASCEPNTMDCGGGCLCHEGRCAARLAQVPVPQVVPR
jgi:hypothetical protein